VYTVYSYRYHCAIVYTVYSYSYHCGIVCTLCTVTVIIVLLYVNYVQLPMHLDSDCGRQIAVLVCSYILERREKIQKKLTDVCFRLFRYSAFYTFLRVTVLIR